MLAEKFLLLETLIRIPSRTCPDGSPRVISSSPHVPVQLPTPAGTPSDGANRGLTPRYPR